MGKFCFQLAHVNVVVDLIIDETETRNCYSTSGRFDIPRFLDVTFVGNQSAEACVYLSIELGQVRFVFKVNYDVSLASIFENLVRRVEFEIELNEMVVQKPENISVKMDEPRCCCVAGCVDAEPVLFNVLAQCKR